MKFLIKTASFISTLFPITIFLLLILYFDYNSYFSDALLSEKWIKIIIWVLFGCTIISIIFIKIFFSCYIPKVTNVNCIKVINFEKERTGSSNYLLQNILPIAAFMAGGINFVTIVFICVLLLLLFVMFCANDLYYINPIFDIFKIKTYSAEIAVAEIGKEFDNNNTRKVIIITELNANDLKMKELSGVEMDNRIFFTREKN